MPPERHSPALWMLALAPIAAAYKDQNTGTGDQRSTWRTDRYSPCPRADAGTWLAFLARAGYPLSPIEQAVADGVPYHGDAPSNDLTADADRNSPGDEADPPGPVSAISGEPGEDADAAPLDAPEGGGREDATAPLAA
jgi:hypothetical protein